MRLFARLLLLVTLAGLTAGPLVAAPLIRPAGATVEAPADGAGSGAWALLPWAAIPVVFGAIRIKDTASLAKKFVARAGQAQGDYTEGVKAAGADWEAGAKAGEDNYKIGVAQAASDGRYGRGIANAGSGKYVARASTLGAQRYPSGVGAAEGDWSRGAAPYLDALKSIDLPPRRPKGDPGNMARSQAVAAKLRAMKVGK